MKKIYLFFAIFMFSSIASGQLSQISDPLMLGGRIKASAKNANCVLVTNEGGIFKTTNQGLSWSVVSQTFDPKSIQCDEIQSIGNDFYARSNSQYGSNVYKSTNDGANWTLLPFTGQWSIQAMGKFSNTLYVVSNNWSTGEGRLYATTDGTNWTPKAILWTNNWQGGNCEFLNSNANKLIFELQDNLYYTTNGDVVSQISSSGLGSSDFSRTDDINVDGLGNLFVRNNNVIYKYNFSTQTWGDITTGKIPATYQIINFSVTENALFLSAMPPAEGMKIYKSVNRGTDFTLTASTGLVVPMLENIIEVGTNKFIGNSLYDELMFSSNGGETWTANASQFIGTHAPHLVRSGNSILYSRENNGITLSANLGANWTLANEGIPSFGGGIAYFIDQLTSVKDTLFSFLRPDPFSDNLALYKSSNNGVLWKPMPIGTPFNTMQEYTFAGSCDSLLYVSFYNPTTSYYSLIYSSTNGASWLKPSVTNSPSRIFVKGSSKCLFGFYESNNGDWEDFDKVYKANSFGMSFSNISINDMFSNLRYKRVLNDEGRKSGPMMDFDKLNDRSIFVICDRSMGYTKDKLYLYKSPSIWTELPANGLPTEFVGNCIKFVGNNTWFLATNLGLYKSTNGGFNWTITHPLDNWIKGMVVNSIQKIDNKVFLGTLSNGVWVVDLNVPFVMPNSMSAYFDGTQDRIRVLDASPMNPAANPSAYQITGKSITVEAWIYPMRLPKKADAAVLVCRPYYNSTTGYHEPWRSFELRIDNFWGPNDDPRIQWIVSDGNSLGNTEDALDPNPPVVGAWTHVAGTYDGSKLKLYINGNLVNESVFTSDIGAGEVGLYFGGITSQYFNGLIDEVRLWNVVRTQSQIQAAMHQTLMGNEAGLKGYWPMEEVYQANNGAFVTKDKTPNNNDMPVQFDAKLIGSPAESTVQIAPSYLTCSNAYAVVGEKFSAKLSTNGWPLPNISLPDYPSGMTFVGDSLFWTPNTNQRWGGQVVAKINNSAGFLVDTIYVETESFKTAQNQIKLDVSDRGRLGAMGSYQKGLYYKGKYGLYSASFGLVDRDDLKFAGGLFYYPFCPKDQFTNLPSRFPSFTSTMSSFTDEWEKKPIGVLIEQTVHSSTVTGDDKYAIVEYKITNKSGYPVGDLFAQLTADFDIGLYSNNLAGYDPTTQAIYTYESGGATNPYYYGYALLNKIVSGAAAFNVDSLYIRKTGPLTNIEPNPTAAKEYRNQLNTGPYQLTNDQSFTVAFAVFAGDDLNDIKASATRAKQVYIAGTPTNLDIVNADASSEFLLYQNYPNPFSSSTQISYKIAKEGKVSLKVFDLQGKELITISDGFKQSGTYTEMLDLRDFPSGIYYYQLKAEGFVATKKLVLMK